MMAAQQDAAAGERPERRSWLSARDVERAMKVNAKVPFVVFGVPLATWFGIRAYWEWLRWSGEAPTYYVASMAGLRACSVMPLQLLVMCALVLVSWRVLIKSSWIVIAIA